MKIIARYHVKAFLPHKPFVVYLQIINYKCKNLLHTFVRGNNRKLNSTKAIINSQKRYKVYYMSHKQMMLYHLL